MKIFLNGQIFPRQGKDAKKGKACGRKNLHLWMLSLEEPIPERKSALAGGTTRALRLMAHAAAFHQMKKLFGKVFGVIAGALKRLRHQKQVSAVVPATILAVQLPLKYGATNLVNTYIGLHDPVSRFQFALSKSTMNGFQHSLKDIRHGNQIMAILLQ